MEAKREWGSEKFSEYRFDQQSDATMAQFRTAFVLRV